MPLILLAHGLGDAGDLPVPFDLVVLASGIAVLGAAALVSARSPRIDPTPSAETAVPAERRGAPWRTAARSVTAVLLGLLIALAIAGPNDPTISPVPRLVYGVFWPALIIGSVLLGPWWVAANPVRLLAGGLARLSGDPRDETARPVPAGLGVWPAAALLAVFLWGEVAPAPRPHTVAFLLTLIVLGLLAGTLRHGRAWIDHTDPFEAYARALGRLSPLGQAAAGTTRLRSPRRALATWSAPPGLLALLAVTIGADAFDGVLGLLAYQNWKVGMPPGGRVLADTAVFAGCIGLAYLLGWIATRPARALLPALVPVAAGYAAAHYLAISPIEAQVAVRQLSDPLARGWDLLGTGGVTGASYDVVPGLLAALVVLGVLLAGHIAAVVVANDIATATRKPRAARAVQVPLRAVLVVSMLASVFVRFGGG